MSSSYTDSVRPDADIRRITRIFDRRAASFAEVAFLNREVAQRMRERLDYIKIDARAVLDAGCGQGDDLASLATRFTQSTVYGIDASPRMLSHVPSASAPASGLQRLLPGALRERFASRRPPLAQADFGALPFAPGVFDLVWSNLALHWHPRPHDVFPEWNRVLKTGGLLMFSTFGPDTFKELRAAMSAVESEAGATVPHRGRRVIDFTDMHDFGDMLVNSGFEVPVMDVERLTVTYPSADKLLADVRRWGAYPFGDRASERLMGLGSKRWRAALGAALERQRGPDGTIALSFELVYGHAWKAQVKATAEGHAIVRADEIGGRRRKM
ncbi:methyltransferase domain-containing protein [Pararobbsia silviterrae]|uniref:Malonyl-[acyl-carrier protein] O-methyltransferase n=1 Tax=Pararobbsia silviterrae TaxID=1792498 RepID=A0A494Y8R4_9BURK|nr:methyltransferase domain-containing protein [Pararobbsia silviterrae]RKP58796.1 methyltransferase domain-containing protein [Pararobbsia silviterrae]